MPQMLSEMLSFFTEILEAQESTHHEVTAEVHPIPEDIDLEVKLEQEEEEEGKEDEGGEVEVVSAASALLLLFQPKKEPVQPPENTTLWEGNWQTPFNICYPL